MALDLESSIKLYSGNFTLQSNYTNCVWELPSCHLRMLSYVVNAKTVANMSLILQITSWKSAMP